MTFRELLEKYKQGTLTEKEKLLVESELEKNEAINDYLAENLDLNNICDDNPTTATNSTTKKIKHTVNLKLAKIVAISVTLVFAIIFATKYIVSPLVASQYYNPTKHTIEKNNTDFFYDLRALNELTNPGYGIRNALSEDNGFGSYSLTIECGNLFTQESSTFNTNLKKNRQIDTYDYLNIRSFVLYNPSWFDPKLRESGQRMAFDKISSAKKIEYLKKLPITSYVSAYILLDNPLTLEALEGLRSSYTDLEFNWAAVLVSDDSVERPVGFRMQFHGDATSNDLSYYKKYPALVLNDYLYNDTDSSNGIIPGYEKHFKSLLQYLSDNNEAVKALTYYNLDFNQYLDYIETNGINVYGLLVFGTPDEIVSLYENENMKTINIDNVLPSIYSTKYNY